MAKRIWSLGIVGAAIVLAVASVVELSGRQQTNGAVRIDNDDIGGVVTSTKGPEAGVWVIAETTELPTKFVRIVVTDDRGRYVVPDLPKANYNVWVRGYGLVDSAKVQAAPGRTMNLSAVLAPNPRAAAEYFPPNYWYSLLQVPPKSDFPGTGAKGNGLAEGMTSQPAFISRLKAAGCEVCHQMGNKATREIPKALGVFDSSAGRVGSPRAGRTGRWRHEQRAQPHGSSAGAGDVRGLERSDRRRRGTADAAAAARAGAQRGRHDVGLRRTDEIYPRRQCDRQAQAHGQRQRAHLRCTGRELGRTVRDRSGS